MRSLSISLIGCSTLSAKRHGGDWRPLSPVRRDIPSDSPGLDGQQSLCNDGDFSSHDLTGRRPHLDDVDMTSPQHDAVDRGCETNAQKLLGEARGADKKTDKERTFRQRLSRGQYGADTNSLDERKDFKDELAKDSAQTCAPDDAHICEDINKTVNCEGSCYSSGSRTDDTSLSGSVSSAGSKKDVAAEVCRRRFTNRKESRSPSLPVRLVDQELMKAYSNSTPAGQSPKVYFTSGKRDSAPSNPQMHCRQLSAEQAEYIQLLENMSDGDDPGAIYLLDKVSNQSGPFGRVHPAVDRRDSSLVTVQVIDVSAHLDNLFLLCHELLTFTNFLHEAVTDHVGCHYSRSTGELWLVTQRPDGTSLASLIQSEGSAFSDERVVAEIAKWCAMTVQCLQQHNLTHHLLNADSVFVSASGALTLCRAGICSQTWSASRQGPGNSAYCAPAPEIIKRKHYSSKVDSWSLGILVYEMLQQHKPFHELQPNKAFSKIARTGVRKCLKSLKASPETVHFLDRCLKRRPLKRASMNEIVRHPFLRKCTTTFL